MEEWLTKVNAAEATNSAALAQLERAQLQFKSEIDGVNTTVANMESQLQLAQYYLDNTTLTAPEDGYIINLQVRPGMVAGTYSTRRHRRLDRGCRPLSACDLFSGESQICKVRPVCRSRA